MEFEQLSHWYIFGAVLAAAVGTALTRFLPFFMLRNSKDMPLLRYLQLTMPLLIMTLLVFFTLKDVDWNAHYGLYEIGGIACVVVCFLWSRNAILSMFAGMIVYMVIRNLF
ncbi:branched-chain amino acid transporter permease [Helicobacter turcicus]|uniref:AzlD domain-containing protein n=1 Tax=Helicobacter turcicus TaxID=2867412 RepID=A0ABS7JL50_9HELI|nr:AzlD domain-containing protein [Helicobacter turcicus]MBX7490119.1 AzlD domain-containing protein [Helicobacter turcicus]MBX7544978.1 AzlD domain-containing protein [Helicobacter turcicus]